MILIRNISAILISLTLVIAIGGVTVFQHFCSCEQTSSVSLYLEKSCCDHRSDSYAGCCGLQDENNSCNKDGKDCCSTTTKFLKVSNPFNVPVKSHVVKPLTYLFAGILFYQNITSPLFSPSPLHAFNDTSPPVTEAKSLLITHHQLKLSPDHLS